MLQTGQRIGSAIGISAVGAVFFGRLTSTRGDWSTAISAGLLVTTGLVVLALLLGMADLVLTRRARPAPAGGPAASAGPDPTGPAGEPTRGSTDGLRGRVRDETGAAVGGAVLTLVDATGREGDHAVADHDGVYHLHPADAGSYQLVVRGPGRTPEASRVVVGAHGARHDVTLSAAGVPD